MKKKCFIFDLDKTLWNFTAEKNINLSKYNVKKLLFKDTIPVIKLLKHNNKIICIASKCWYPNLSIKYLEYSGINKYINNHQLFPTGINKEYPYKLIDRYDKQYHIYNILNKYNIDSRECVYFDDNIKIINNLKKNINNMESIHIKKGIKLHNILDYL